MTLRMDPHRNSVAFRSSLRFEKLAVPVPACLGDVLVCHLVEGIAISTDSQACGLHDTVGYEAGGTAVVRVGNT